MLCALNRMTELAVHVRGAVNNGVTETEIRETLMQVAVYCGLPAGLEGVSRKRSGTHQFQLGAGSCTETYGSLY